MLQLQQQQRYALCKHSFGVDLKHSLPKRASGSRCHWCRLHGNASTTASLMSRASSRTAPDSVNRTLTVLSDPRSTVKSVVKLKEPQFVASSASLMGSDLAPPVFASRVTYPLRRIINHINVSFNQRQSSLPTQGSPLSTIHSLDTLIITTFAILPLWRPWPCLHKATST